MLYSVWTTNHILLCYIISSTVASNRIRGAFGSILFPTHSTPLLQILLVVILCGIEGGGGFEHHGAVRN